MPGLLPKNSINKVLKSANEAWSGPSPNTAFKKKLFKLNPQEAEKQAEIKIQQTKRKQQTIKVSQASNERYVREQLASKVSGSHMGLWLLIPEYLRLGVWDLVKGMFNGHANRMASQLALQMINESALCVSRIRERGSLCHQGFSLVNGLSFLASDESIHDLLDSQSMQQYEEMQVNLLRLRGLQAHYQKGEQVLALDPHRILSASQRIMARKKKRPEEPSRKMMQTFFCNDVVTGQPLGFTIASTGKTCSKATLQLLQLMESAGIINNALILADKEHFTEEISAYFHHHNAMDMLVPAPDIKPVTDKFKDIDFHPHWAGYALGETQYNYHKSDLNYRLIVQREGELPQQYSYVPFLTTSQKSATELLTRHFSRRWSIEEFFNFEGDMGWNRASTFNLNIRYGKQSLALLAQAATYQLKNKLPKPYSQWTAAQLASKVLTNMEGDIRVKDDTIIVTYYRDHENLNLQDFYEGISQKLTNEGVNPKIPWLFDFKLDFRFK